jgi:hypothetical protein
MEKHMDNQLMEKDKYFLLFSGLQMHDNIGKSQKKRIQFAYVGSGSSSDVHNGPS